MKSFVLVLVFCVGVMICNMSFGQRAGRQAVQMARGGGLFHSLNGRSSHQGVGYGMTRMAARQNVCQSGSNRRWIRVRRGDGGFYAVANTRRR